MKRHTSNWWKQFYRGLYRIRQNNLCYYCKVEMDDTAPKQLANSYPKSATLEHMYPRGHELRGKTKAGWVTACWQCNQQKSTEWAKHLEMKCAASRLIESNVGSTRNPMDASAGTAPPTPPASPQLTVEQKAKMIRCTVFYTLVPTLG